MTQQIQIGARLSPATTGTLIGYRIDTLGGTEYTAFTRTGVVELDVAGAWHVADPITVPDAGAIVYWGTSGTDLLAESYGPAADVATLAAIATVDAVVDSIAVQTTAIVADTNELQADWANGGRLDTILDARASQTSVDTVDTVVDAILLDTAEIGSAGAGLTALATQSSVDAIDNYIDTEVAAIKAVTDQLPNGGALTTITNNVAAILADTGTDGVVLSSTTLNAIADALLKRSVSNVESTASTHSLAEIILAMLESSAPSTTWTIRRTDGTTFNTRTLTELSTALPVVGVT